MNTEEIHVLLVEDAPNDANLVQDVLRNSPEISLDVVGRLSDAVNCLLSKPVDTVLTDLGLPDSQGLDTLRTLIKANPQKPVVVLTGNEDHALGRKAIKLGAQDFLLKPVMKGSSLARILHYAVERKRADQLLRISETRYQRLHESLMDGFVLVDMEGHIVDSNSTFQKMLGYSEEELHSLTYMQLTPERWHAFESEIVARQIIPRGYSEVYEKEYRRKDGELFPIELRTSLLRDESGVPVNMWAIVRDLSERKKLENSLRASEGDVRRKLDSVLSPEGDLGILELEEIIDVPGMQSLMDSFYKLNGIPMSIIDLKGKVLVGVGWQDICTKFHRIHPDTCSGCVESDTVLSKGISRGEFKQYKCKNNMWDIATPIIVGDRHVGSVFVGQFFFSDESPDYELFRAQARRNGFNEEEYIAALESVPRLSRESIDAGMAFFMKLADMLSKLSYSNIKIARSLAERDRLMNSLRASEARLSNALKIARLGHWEYDVHKDLFTFNDHFYDVLRTTVEQEGGYTMTSKQYMERFVHPDDRSMVTEKIYKDLKTVDGRYFDQQEHRIIYADGQVGYTSVRFFAKKDDLCGQVKTYGVNQDITERKHAESELEERDAQYQLIANNTTDVIWLFDLNLDRFIYISPSVEKLRGFKVEEALSHPMQNVLTTASYRMLTENLSKRVAAFEAGDDSVRTQTYEVDQVRKDGTIIATETVTTLIAGKQNHVTQLQGISRDITERKSLQTQLIQAQKMEAVGRLAGGIAHDFNNLLTIILGYSNSLMDSFPKDDSVRENLEQIRNAGNRATALTSMLLAFSRKQILQPKVINIKTLVQDSSKLLRRLIGEDIELVTDLASDLGCVKVDNVQMDQVIMNLAVNSRDAMPLGGKLIIKARNIRLDKYNVIAQAGLPEGEYVMLAISDTGVGMDAEVKSHIFEPFYTTKTIGKGTGIGLATVYGIINQSGGLITIDSEPERGATFTIYLPRVYRADALIETSEVMSADGSETILLVEDDNEVRKLASQYLCVKGYTVLEADNGPNALRIAEEYGRTIHLLITDMVMPGGMNGIELIKFVRRSHPNIEALIVTGYIGDYAANGAPSPDIIILQKPFTAEDLTRSVREVLQGRKAQGCRKNKSSEAESFSLNRIAS